MPHRTGLLAALVLLAADAYADNSIVIGQGIKVDGVLELPGDWESGYVWLVKAGRTVSGPIVKGKIRVIAASHAQPKDSYLKTVQLFVLAPVVGDGAASSVPKYSLIASSPLYGHDQYCIWPKPSEIAIPLSDAEVERDEHGAYCFSEASLLKASTSSLATQCAGEINPLLRVMGRILRPRSSADFIIVHLIVPSVPAALAYALCHELWYERTGKTNSWTASQFASQQ
jgi:hypothetical protein